jgi:hypothetical protein
MLTTPTITAGSGGYVPQPYFMQLTFDAQTGTGTSADAPNATRNNSNRIFACDRLGFATLATGSNNSRSVFGFKLFKTTESSSLTQDFIEVNSITSYANPIIDLPIPYLIGINESITGSNILRAFGAQIDGVTVLTSDTLRITLFGILQ